MELKKLGCIIQARTTSTRLPQKVLKTLDFETNTCILENVIHRVSRVSEINEIIVATTTNPSDDKIQKLVEKKGVLCYRGSELDVLERYYEAARLCHLDTVIRITSDCPFIDADVISDLIHQYKESNCDYISNGQNRTYPHGLDCEIFSFKALEQAYYEGKDSFYREHVTTFLYSNPERFRLGSLELKNENYSNIRITVDTQEDYILACLIQDYLRYKGDFSYQDIVKLYKDKPFLKFINEGSLQKQKFLSEKDELSSAKKLLLLQEMKRAAEIIDHRICELGEKT
ncbi:glycosyltransferase family protein [bacterium 210820-DFI.6.37]|nr:glycosyltransferase family protein [bacterium 210820-DFI.6.37]